MIIEKKKGEKNMKSMKEKEKIEGRLRWYRAAVEFRRRRIMPPIGFPLPDGEPSSWEQEIRRLENLLKSGT